MPQAREVLSASAMGRALSRMASEIVDHNGGCRELAFVGIRRRGVPLAERLAARLERSEGVSLPVGALDITLYRDDLTPVGPQPIVGETEIPFEVEERVIVLVDDVLFTGRTVRAALDALVSLGRPRGIQLAVLIDRGHRELPIAADYVGRTLETRRDELVQVALREVDGVDLVSVQGVS